QVFQGDMAQGWPQMKPNDRGIAVISRWSDAWLLILFQPRIQPFAHGQFVRGYERPPSHIAQGSRELFGDLLTRLSVKSDPLQLPGVGMATDRHTSHVFTILAPGNRPLVITSPFCPRHRVPLP